MKNSRSPKALLLATLVFALGATTTIASDASGAAKVTSITCYQADATHFNALQHPSKKPVKVAGVNAVCPVGFTPNKYVDFSGMTLNVADTQGFYQLLWGTGVQKGVVDPNKLGFTVHFDELNGPGIVAAVINGADHVTPVVSTASWAEALDNGQVLSAVGINQLVNPGNYWQVLVSPTQYAAGITSAANLAGLKIAYPAGGDSQYVVDSLLRKNHIVLNNYSYSNLSEANALSALMGGSVQAIVVSPVVAAQAQAMGNKVIATGAGIVNGYSPILMTPSAIKNPKTMAMVAAYLYQGALIDKWILNNQTAFTQVIFNAFFAPSPATNGPVGQALSSVLYTTGINRFVPITKALKNELHAEALSLYYDGILQNSPKVLSGFNPVFTQELTYLNSLIGPAAK